MLVDGSVIDGKVVSERSVHRVCRLAGGCSQVKGLSSHAREQTLLVLQEFVDACHMAGITQFRAVGTAAFRLASNGPVFASETRDKLGIPFEISPAIGKLVFYRHGRSQRTDFAAVLFPDSR